MIGPDTTIAPQALPAGPDDPLDATQPLDGDAAPPPQPPPPPPPPIIDWRVSKR